MICFRKVAEDAIDGVLKDVSKDNPSVIVCSSICETYFCCDEAIDKMSTAKGGFIYTISLSFTFQTKGQMKPKSRVARRRFSQKTNRQI